MFELKNIVKIYKTNVEDIEVLKDVNLTINKGDFISIQGKSGSGKSSLLNIIGLLDDFSFGKIYINKENIELKDKRYLRNKYLGFVFQFHYLLNEFTALENIMLPALINKEDKEKIRKRALELINLVGLKDRVNHRPNQLSGGEKQRVAIARALINNPEIILADEPTGNLDNETSEIINELFVKLNKMGHSIIIVTHSIELANLAKDKYKIINGKLVKLESENYEK